MADDYDLIGNVHAADALFGAQVGQTVLKVHGPDACRDEFCCIHHPSNHVLRDAPLNWRGDRGFMERICSHGIGHPDPDSLAFLHRRLGDAYEGYAFDVHGCDGCCRSSASQEVES